MKTLLKGSIQSRRGWPALMVLLALLCRPASAQTTVISNYTQFASNLLHAPVNSNNVRLINNFRTNSTISLTTAGETFDITNNVTIDGGTNGVVFSGSQAGRLFNVHSNCQLILNNLAVVDFASTNGGAIFNRGTLIISNCTIANNAATNSSGTNGSGYDGNGNGESGTSGGTAEGGAIYSTGAVFIYYSVVGTNTAEGGTGGSGAAGENGLLFGGNGGNGGSGGGAYGAAIFSTGSNNVFFATEFIDNVCTAGSGGSGGAGGSGAWPSFGGTAGSAGWVAGGAVFVSGTLFMSNCVFSQNTITAGTSGSDGSGNDAPNGGTAEGGGLFISTLVSNAYVVNCVFFDNACTAGGGGSSTADASGGNGGSAYGGGLASGAALTWVRNCTLATNSLTAGTNGTGGAGSGSNGATNGFDIMCGVGVIELSGSILSGGTNSDTNSTLTSPNAYGVTDAGYNISSDTSLARIFTTTLTNINPVLDSGLSDVGPTVGPPDVSGPELATLAIVEGSPATNFIPGVPGVTFPAADEVGNARGSPTSAGAFELNPITLDTNANLKPPTVTLVTNAYYTTSGGMVVLQVTATNSSDTINPMGYQWQFNGTNLSDNKTYIGTTTSDLTVKDVGPAEEGTNYQVVVGVSTLEGVTTSAVVSLTIEAKPNITLQPAGKTVYDGSVVTLSIAANGAESYQWRSNNVALTDTNEFSGVTTATLTISPATFADEASYSVLVTNAFGSTNSEDAVLKVVADTEPTVAFSNSPPANARTNDLVVTGTATDNAQVVAVNYRITNVNAGNIPVTNVTPGSASLGVGTTTRAWFISNVFLPGTNYVTVQSSNYAGSNSIQVTREFFYIVPAPFNLYTLGSGTVTGTASVAGNLPTNNAMLNVGEGYTLTAHPDNANYVLTNWTGSNASIGAFTNNGLTLPFIMESNETVTATFSTNLFNGAKGIYNGLFYGSNSDDISNVTEQTAGMLYNLDVMSSGSYSGTLLLNGASLTLAAGSFNASGSTTNVVPRTAAQGGRVTVEMLLNWTNGQINGTVSGTNENGWTSVLYAEKAATESPSNEYTVLLTPGTNAVAGIPPGFGYMLITNHDGTVNLSSGALADGSTFNQTTPLGVSNDVPVYYGKLYSSAGLLMGWLGLSNGTVTEETQMVWIKPATRSGPYTNAFTNLLSVTGAGWTNPLKNEAAISLIGGTLTVTNASSNLNLLFYVSVTTNNTVVKVTNSPPPSQPTNSLTGTIAPATGLLTITFGNGAGNHTTVGYGAILQNSNSGAGYFTNGGLILLTPP